MMTPIVFEDDLAFTDLATEHDAAGVRSSRTISKRPDRVHLIGEKLVIPTVSGLIKRPRVTGHLERHVHLVGANLVSGRAQTGKTYAAVDLASKYQRVAWYSVDSTDRDWTTFASYFAASFSVKTIREIKPNPTESEITAFLTKIFARFEKTDKGEPILIVLDDIHHVFDAPWFSSFFKLLLSSLLPNTHLLMLCRSKPPLPLWRLRSKQVLNVVDERFLAFDKEESEQLCKKLGLKKNSAAELPAAASRIGKMVKFLQATSS